MVIINPRTGRAFTDAAALATILNSLQLDTQQTVGPVTSFIMRDAVQEATSKVAEGVAREVGIFSKALARKYSRNRDGRVTRIHKIAGEQAQIATIRSFQRTKSPEARRTQREANPVVSFKRVGRDRELIAEARERGGQGFRLPAAGSRGDRYANGAMLRALQDPGFYVASWDGVGIINAAHMDQVAKQWYRLNFGAGTRGRENTPGHRTYNVEFFGAVAGQLSLERFKPSPDFRMPPGLWLERSGLALAGTDPPGAADKTRRGADLFLPSGQVDSKFKKFITYPGGRTRGIEGKNFLDAGVFALAQNLGRGWTVLMAEWFKEAAEQDTGPVSNVAGKTESEKAVRVLRRTLGKMERDFELFKSRYTSL